MIGILKIQEVWIIILSQVIKNPDNLSEKLVINSTCEYIFKQFNNPTIKLDDLISGTDEEINIQLSNILKFYDYYDNNILHIILGHRNYKLFFELINYISLKNLLHKNSMGNSVLSMLDNLETCELAIILQKRFPNCTEIKQLKIFNDRNIKNTRGLDNNIESSNKKSRRFI